MRTCEHMILGQLRMGVRQAKNAPLAWCYLHLWWYLCLCISIHLALSLMLYIIRYAKNIWEKRINYDDFSDLISQKILKTLVWGSFAVHPMEEDCFVFSITYKALNKVTFPCLVTIDTTIYQIKHQLPFSKGPHSFASVGANKRFRTSPRDWCSKCYVVFLTVFSGARFPFLSSMILIFLFSMMLVFCKHSTFYSKNFFSFSMILLVFQFYQSPSRLRDEGWAEKQE